MEELYDLLKNILPAVITGWFTFLITRYTYYKNHPLDKLEITYHKVYYPLYKYIFNEKYTDNMDFVIKKFKHYLKKYDIYIERSTKMTFKNLCKCMTDAEKKIAYQDFKNNIFDKNVYLRRKLGYLEPNFWEMYIYLPNSQKATFRIVVEFFIACLCIFSYSLPVEAIQ